MRRTLVVIGLVALLEIVAVLPGMTGIGTADDAPVVAQSAGGRVTPPRAAALADLLGMPGQVSLLVRRDRVDQYAYGADTPLAVASAVKLAVLASLRDQVDSGERSWDDIVTLQPTWKTLPSGVLQAWPTGAPLTIDTLASLMISLSDNTATNALIDVVGRDAVEARTPRNRPLLNMSELFALKDPANADLLSAYRVGDEDHRRTVVALAAQRPTPQPALFNGDPLATDVEFFFTVRELCDLIEPLADLPLMGISPGVAGAGTWSRVAYKGGNEPGVFNLTHALLDDFGRTWCVAVTINDTKPIEEREVMQRVQRLIAALR